MKSYAVVLLSAGVLGTVIGFAQSTKETSASHVAVAKAAARQEHTALFGLCRALEPAPPAERGQRAATQPQSPPDRSQWHAEPVKVFDNLYFVGMTEYSSWAVNTSDGIIIIDAIFDYSVEDEIDSVPNARSYARHNIHAYSCEGRRQTASCGRVGRHSIQLASKQNSLYHSGKIRPLLV